MWRMRLSSTRSADVLDAHADHARQALACAYSTSDEYEAAVIAARRQAGAYGRDPCRRWRLLPSPPCWSWLLP